MPRTGCPTGSSTQGLHRWKKTKRLCVSWGEKLKQQNHRFDGISKNDKHVQLKACFEREPQKWKTSGRSWSGTWSLPLHMRWSSSWRSCWWWCWSIDHAWYLSFFKHIFWGLKILHSNVRKFTTNRAKSRILGVHLDFCTLRQISGVDNEFCDHGGHSWS